MVKACFWCLERKENAYQGNKGHDSNAVIREPLLRIQCRAIGFSDLLLPRIQEFLVINTAVTSVMEISISQLGYICESTQRILKGFLEITREKHH